MINEHDIKDMRYAVIDEDGETIRRFNRKEDAEAFLLRTWSIVEIQASLFPCQMHSRFSDAYEEGL